MNVNKFMLNSTDIPPMVEAAKALATDINNAEKLARWRQANEQVRK